MKVKEIMSPKVITINKTESIADAARKMRDNDIGFLPVMAEGKVIGVVTDRDITCRGVTREREPKDVRISDVMSPDAVWCHANEEVSDAIRLMEGRQIRRLPVLDAQQSLVGMLSLGNVSTHVPHELAGEAIEAISRPAPRPPAGRTEAGRTAA